MRRAYAPLELRIDGKHVRTLHMIGWTKPGTVGDRIVKALGTASRRIQPPNLAIRQQRRAWERGYNHGAFAY